MEAVSAADAERVVESLHTFGIKDVASKSWLLQHEEIEKINIQAHLNAVAMRDDFIAEALISMQKMPVLVHELVAIELWRDKVYPPLVALDFAAKSTITPYITLYHEATLVSLLEAVLYNREACEACGDAVMDLVDYVHRQIVHLIATHGREPSDSAPEMPTEERLTMSGQKQLEQQTATLPFDIATKCVSILRYVTDNMTRLPLSVMTRMLNVHDFPCLLVSLMTSSPWTRQQRGGALEKYSEGKWSEVPAGERLRLTKQEAQVWLAIYNLVMEPECRRKYIFNSYNVEELLKLRGFFNEVLVDQLPILGELRRALEQMSMARPPAPEPSVLLEQLPEIREHLSKAAGNKWKRIAEHQYTTCFNLDDEALRENAKRLAETYDLTTMDALMPEAPRCVKCGQPAVKRCSRCHSEWYCRRQCQVEHWPAHKAACTVAAEPSGSG